MTGGAELALVLAVVAAGVGVVMLVYGALRLCDRVKAAVAERRRLERARTDALVRERWAGGPRFMGQPATISTEPYRGGSLKAEPLRGKAAKQAERTQVVESRRDDGDLGFAVGMAAMGYALGASSRESERAAQDAPMPEHEGGFGGAGASAEWEKPSDPSPAYEPPSSPDPSPSPSYDSSPSVSGDPTSM